MPSERIQRRIDAFLDEADEASTRGAWAAVTEKARAVLAIDEANEDAAAFLKMAEANLGATAPPLAAPAEPTSTAPPEPSSFAAGRYQVRRFLGEGGRKRVFLAHDALLDRDVAFALIKTDGLDDVGRQRIVREAQAMGRMGTHPHLVSIFDMGEEQGAPYVVTELMQGGDVEGELERAGGALELTRALAIAAAVARGLAFAHERGIVHRDLKPGNVWLTSEGVAKIGDFGLAVAEGRSRLTQHGMMVGTFAYMPPEQALGGEATPRSDLYSLGAMLYELVTGRPPFQGDSATAVISQHLNTAPVAPSWHTQHCPPALEDLILALLAKDPPSRPASAAEVLAVLERIDPGQPSRSHSSDTANPLDRLARGVFVGRERELERLRSALDSAFAGRGSVVLLVGEPGIGKTRTTQELETYARMRGAKVLWGRAHESSGAPPYWPWVQVARAYREETPDADVRRRQYEPYAAELQRIFPALRELFPNLPEPPAETEEGQFRLFDAFSAFARSVAVETPLVFVLDDLHWADRATLALLTHLARELGRARILVCGTYRDTDLDRRHPLAQALAELSREDLFTRIPLRGLSLKETADYVRRAANVEPPRELVTRIFEETEGNPFFLAEVVNLMTQEGTLASTARDVQIPEGVRQALGRRLDRLSDDANALLTTLAVAGRDFEHALVRALSPHDDATTLQLVEEALRARVLEETGAPGRYRFTHALMQETLLGELSAARRVLLHGQIAEVFERLYGEAGDTLAAIASHYRESAVLNPAHARNAARYLRLAAESAASALAYDDAARLYEQCLELVTAAPDRLGEDEAALTLAVGEALIMMGNRAQGWRLFDDALSIFESREPLEFARAVLRIWPVSLRADTERREPLIARAAAALGSEPSVEACHLLALRCAFDYGVDGDRAFASAVAMATTLGLKGIDYPDALISRPAGMAVERGDFEQAEALASRRFEEAVASGRDQRLAHTLRALVPALAGDPARTRQYNQQAIDHFRSEGLKSAAANHVAWLALQMWRQGDASAAKNLLTDIEADSALNARLAASEIACVEGDLERAIELCPSEDDPQDYNGMQRGMRIRLQVLRGEAAPAERLFASWREVYVAQRSLVARVQQLSMLDDALCAVGDEILLTQIAGWLDALPHVKSWFSGVQFDYLRGAISLRLDRVDEAEQHFRTGLEWASRPDVRFEVDAGRCLQGLAEVAERRGQHLEAMQHLDAAGELFARHGAKLYLDQVIAKKQILKA